MSGTFDRRPELMILIAVVVSAVLGLFCMVGGCAAITAAAANSGSPSSGGYTDIPDDLLDDDSGYEDLDSILDDIYDETPADDITEDDVPAVMDIEVPELQDDLQTMINFDITSTMGLDEDQQVTITELTKDKVGTPALKNGQVLCEVSGKATVKNAAGETGTIDYTSYYYADDPKAENIIWYIYAYDLGSYDLFPDGFKLKSGDPLGYRSYLLDGDSGSNLLRDHGRDAATA